MGPNGFRELSGGVRVSKLIENHAFSCVFLRFCVIQRALRSSLFFQTWYENRAFSRIFGAAGVITVPCLLFRRFGLLALQKRHPKLILGISRAMHGPKNLIL